jgi:hypothetical protein
MIEKMRSVKFTITKEETIREVQDMFSKFYPNLKINFFKNREGHYHIDGESIIICKDASLGEINPGFSDGVFEIPGNMTVEEIENKIYREYGFSIQIFRESDLIRATTPKRDPVIYFSQVPYGC